MPVETQCETMPSPFKLIEPERRLDRREWLNALDYSLVTDETVLKEWANGLRAKQDIGADWETAPGLGARSALDRFALTGPVPVGLSLSSRDNQGLYVPLNHTTDADLNLPEGMVFDLLRQLDAAGHHSIWWNYLYDGSVMSRRGLELLNWEDAMVASWVFDPLQREIGLKAAAKRLLGVPVISYDSVTSGRSFAELSPREATAYAAGDADHTRQLWKRVTKDAWFRVQEGVYSQIEKPFLLVFRDEIPGGIGIHRDRLRVMGDQLGTLGEDMVPQGGALLDAYNTVMALAGRPINLNSAQQVGKLLVELGVPIVEETDGGDIATGMDVLEKYPHPACQALVRWRKLLALKKNYIDKIEAACVELGSDWLRFPFKQCGAPTGRTACGSDGYSAGFCPVNVQSTPKVRKSDKAWYPDVRTVFIPFPGSDEWVQVAVDYSQLQLRIAANLSGETAWVDAFKAGRDIHQENATLAYGSTEGADKRDVGKTMSFAILFQAADSTVAAQGGISVAKAGELTERFRESTPMLQDWVKRQQAQGQTFKWVQTYFGRRQSLERFYRETSRGRFNKLASEGDRIAVNMPVQGTEADVVKIAAAKLLRRTRERGWGELIRQQLWVHDELVLRVHKSIIDNAVPFIVETMQLDIKNWPVRLTVEAGIGDSWAAAKG